MDLTNSDVMSDQQVVLEKDTVHILRTIFLWEDTAYQRLGVRNYGNRTIVVRLSILFANDFADLFEVRGMHRKRRGTQTAQLRGNDQVAAELSWARRRVAAHNADVRSAAGPARPTAPYTICVSRPAKRDRYFSPLAAMKKRRGRRRFCARSSGRAAGYARPRVDAPALRRRTNFSTKCYAGRLLISKC